MKSLRSKVWVALFFALISLGQAYPYSYAWSLSQHQCGCNLNNRKCIHGCQFRHSKAERDLPHSQAHFHGERIHAHHAQTPSSVNRYARAECVWANPDCSRQVEQRLLSFQGDPFLVSVTPFLAIPNHLSFSLDASIEVNRHPSSPEVPPPRNV